MINQNEDYLKQRWLEYWEMENHDRPLVSIYAPKQKQTYTEIIRPKTIEEYWYNTEYIVKKAKENMKNTYYGGEAFPVINPNLGPDILGGICGCEIAFGEETSWALHHVKDWAALPPIQFQEKNRWWQRIKEMTEYIVQEARSDYLVGMTDLHPGTDGLVSLRGPAELCMDLMDIPEAINPRIGEIFEVYKQVFERLNSIIKSGQDGCTNWMGIWHPEKEWYVTSSDFSCLISEEDFEKFVIPGLLDEISYLPASIYHLDGPGALRHLDRLLRIEKLKGIQWVYGSGQPSARYWIPILQKIQQAGKCIQVNCEKEDLIPVCEALKPEGVHLVSYASTEEEAKALINRIEQIYK